MKKSCIIFGSTTGTTEEVAQHLAAALQIPSEDVIEVYKLTPEFVAAYETLILGSSTWGSGELQDDWYDGVKVLQKSDLKGKKVALFGCGDADSYGDTFCDAIGLIYDELAASGCTFIGAFPTEGYTFDDSAAAKDGMFVGLPLDEVNESGETEDRITQWAALLKKDLG